MSEHQTQSDRTYALFTEWVAAKSDDDFRAILHRGALSRTQIALDCGFALSVLRQNPRIKLALSQLEDDLRARRILPSVSPSDLDSQTQTQAELRSQSDAQPGATSRTSGTHHPADGSGTHAVAGNDLTQAAIRRLQTENASQRAEIAELRQRLQKYESLHNALSSTGRLPR
ncbi:hypothetical protein H0Z09_14155 [Pseudomonas sp. SWRI18]|uniref:VPA1267 family protein n=1 Tax=Pseudomonas sp. SWRI18 TaxID=2753888 RepID=UPI0016486F8D|nr:hypothetical protein [Pseudomonas sp. SWRI18]